MAQQTTTGSFAAARRQVVNLPFGAARIDLSNRLQEIASWSPGYRDELAGPILEAAQKEAAAVRAAAAPPRSSGRTKEQKAAERRARQQERAAACVAAKGRSN